MTEIQASRHVTRHVPRRPSLALFFTGVLVFAIVGSFGAWLFTR